MTDCAVCLGRISGNAYLYTLPDEFEITDIAIITLFIFMNRNKTLPGYRYDFFKSLKERMCPIFLSVQACSPSWQSKKFIRCVRKPHQRIFDMQKIQFPLFLVPLPEHCDDAVLSAIWSGNHLVEQVMHDKFGYSRLRSRWSGNHLMFWYTTEYSQQNHAKNDTARKCPYSHLSLPFC